LQPFVFLGLRHGSGTCVFANDEERWDGIWYNDKMKMKQCAMVSHGNKTEDVDHYVGFDEISIDD
jgi:hypothetical protein